MKTNWNLKSIWQNNNIAKAIGVSVLSGAIVYGIYWGRKKYYEREKLKEGNKDTLLQQENSDEQKECGLYYNIHEKYYGIELVHKGSSFSLSALELIRKIQESVKKQEECITPQQLEFIQHSVHQIYGGYRPTNFQEWLTLAEYIQQKERRVSEPTVPVIVNCGGSKIVIFNPSNRYTFDYGTSDQTEVDISNTFASPRDIRYNTVKILPKGYKGSIEPNPREIWLIQGQKEQVVMHGYWLEGNEELVEKQQTVPDFLKNWPKKAEKIITMESDREQVKQIKLALCIYENPVEEIFNRIISHNRYEVEDRYRDDLKTIPPESRPDVKDITLLYGRHPIYHKSTDAIKPEGRGLTYNFFTKEIIKSGLTDQELTKMVRLLLKGYEQISKFNKETLEREPEEYTSHLQLQPYSMIELDRMPEFWFCRICNSMSVKFIES